MVITDSHNYTDSFRTKYIVLGRPFLIYSNWEFQIDHGTELEPLHCQCVNFKSKDFNYKLALPNLNPRLASIRIRA